MNVSDIDRPNADRLLTTTRSVRRRLDPSRPVPLEVVLDCLDIAQQAPTGSNNRSYRWLLVDDEPTRAALADIYRRGLGEYARATAELEAQSFESRVDVLDDDTTRARDEQTRRVFRSARWLTEHLHEVPVLAIPCMLGRLPDGADNFRAAGFYGSILPAVWSFQLALRTRGLGSVFTILHLVHEREAAELLGIPAHVTQIGLVPVAWYTGTDFKPAARGDVRDVVHIGRWGEGAAGVD